MSNKASFMMGTSGTHTGNAKDGGIRGIQLDVISVEKRNILLTKAPQETQMV